MVLLKIGVHHLQDVFQPEDGTKSLVLAQKTYANETIPFSKVYWRWRILGFDSDNAAFYFGRGFEAIATYFQQVVNLRQELHIDTQSTVHVAAWFCN